MLLSAAADFPEDRSAAATLNADQTTSSLLPNSVGPGLSSTSAARILFLTKHQDLQPIGRNRQGKYADALGYTRSGPTGFITRAETGATITSSSIVGLNRTIYGSDLITFANSLVQYIRSTNPAPLRQISSEEKRLFRYL